MCNFILMLCLNCVAKFQIPRSRSFRGTDVCDFVRCRNFKLNVIAECCSCAFYINRFANLHNIPFTFFHLFCFLSSFIFSLLQTYYCMVNKRFITHCIAICFIMHLLLTLHLLLLFSSDNDNRMQ